LIQHPAWHVPAEHTSPAGQLAFTPSVVVHAVVLVSGWQLWQAGLGLAAPGV
jgi:hypothetical protein